VFTDPSKLKDKSQAFHASLPPKVGTENAMRASAEMQTAPTSSPEIEGLLKVSKW